ncbi:MAG: glutamate--tRNA ligase [Candidatus Margulisbacteria bacterium]|nr:glutamate--tRNA ligase [Candidatus Margulisiibacteriota bacterium]
MTIRTRFAPSPTGHLHIGSARTALFNWLYTKKNKGQFILRIEDTDRERSTPEATQAILDGMTWLGLNWDEGPFFQTKRLTIYNKYYTQLLEQNLAFKKEGAIYIKGDPGKDIDDFVIIKSDGHPVYNFAVVIDDYEMQITHVIRGDDHLSNTPRQIHIYKSLNLKPPKFIHVPMILGSDGERLSKRHGATSIQEFQKMDYLPEAMLNYLARLGWAYGNQEFFTTEDLIDKFSINKLGKSAAVFDKEKLDWLNAEHIKNATAPRLKELISDEYKKNNNIEAILDLVKSRAKTISGLNKAISYFIEETIEYEPKAKEEYLTQKNIELLQILSSQFENISDWTIENIESTVRDFAQQQSLKAGDLIHPLRVALTGAEVSPGIFEVMALMGKNLVLKKIQTIQK